MKQAQTNPDDTSDEAVKAPPAFATHKAKRELIAYPDYARSLVSQRWQDPATTGGKWAVGSGAMGAALGMLMARLAKKDPALVAGGGVAGGALGAIVGNAAGRASANSENSRTFWMRRKPGINDPGEYESALRYMGRPPESIKPREKKAGAIDVVRKFITGRAAGASKAMAPVWQAQKEPIAKWWMDPKNKALAARLGIGAGAGYVWGHELTPSWGGYDNIPTARNISTLSGMAGMMALASGKPKYVPYGLGGLTTGELAPYSIKVLQENANTNRSTADVQAGAAKEVAKSQLESAGALKDVAKGNLGQVLKDTLSSPTAMGTYGGLAAAGVGGLVTGLTRAKSDEEIQKGTSRGKMVAKDFLRYAIPLGLAGGVMGSLKKGPA